MTRTVLVTGANGVVGSHVLEALKTVADVETVALVRDPKRLPTDFSGEVRPIVICFEVRLTWRT